MNISLRILLATLLAGTSAARAATFTVSNLADSGNGSLRDAIARANAASGEPHVVNFQPGLAGSISFSSEIRISSSLVINGPGPAVLTLDGNDTTRLFQVRRISGNPRSVSINGLRFVRGRADNGAAIYAYDDDLQVSDSQFSSNTATASGGAIYLAEADLDLDRVGVVGNSAPSTGQGSGGGISMIAGTLTIHRSLISGNTANFGAGMRIFSPRANAVITDSLIENNIAGHTGGGILAGTMSSFRLSGSAVVGNSTGEPLGGGVYFAGSNDPAATPGIIENTTFSANVTRQSFGQGSALAASGGRLIVRNSTFALNKAAPDSAPISGVRSGALWVDSTGTTVSLESCLFDGNTYGNTGLLTDIAHVSTSTSNPGIVNASDSLFRSMPGNEEIDGLNLRNQFATDALLKPLTTLEGGGFVPVHPLSRLSPAIDRGSNTGNLTWDQRGPGFVRAWTDARYSNDSVFSRADVGAYEFRGDGIFVGDFEQQ